jgi:hypothetical protein
MNLYTSDEPMIYRRVSNECHFDSADYLYYSESTATIGTIAFYLCLYFEVSEVVSEV